MGRGNHFRFPSLWVYGEKIRERFVPRASLKLWEMSLLDFNTTTHDHHRIYIGEAITPGEMNS